MENVHFKGLRINNYKAKIEEITNEMNQKIKDESFFEFINSKTPDEQSAIKNWISIQQEERIKAEAHLY